MRNVSSTQKPSSTQPGGNVSSTHGAFMDGEAFASAQRDLGLSDAELAMLLGVEPQTVRRYKAPPGSSSVRPIPNPTALLVEAVLAGHRPRTWKDVQEFRSGKVRDKRFDQDERPPVVIEKRRAPKAR